MIKRNWRISVAFLIVLCGIQPLLSDNTTSGTLFPGLTGEQLIDSLVANYKPQTVLSYDDARDTMFAVIDNHEDSVSCVYSGYRIYIDPQNDPSSDAYFKDMNTEHTWPQSKGADQGNAKSDLHHLFPTREHVNSSRSNAPLGESENISTDKWWRHDYALTSIPDQFIDEYSEKENDDDWFEPREDHKGDAARAVFYFYTMYREQADDDFFELQKETLYDWHDQDAVDARETNRNDAIAPYQDDKQNPFIIDSTLVRRCYFSDEVDKPADFTATNVTDTRNDLSWEKNIDGDDVMIVWDNEGSFEPPVDGVVYSDGQQALGGTIIARQSATTFIHDNLQINTVYYYQAYSVHGTHGNEHYSAGVESSASTGDDPVQAQPGDILITEIMKNPSAVSDADGEWFEIYNNTDRTIDLAGWYIRDNDYDEHRISDASALLLDGQQYMVLGRNADKAVNGCVQVDYEYNDIALGNSGDEIYLYLDDGSTRIDAVEYDDGASWPDLNGASMYYNGSPDADNNDPSKWEASSTVWEDSDGDLGSPGYDGTIATLLSENVRTPGIYQLKNHPNPFNPSTTITFYLPQAGASTLTIYDLLGRIVTSWDIPERSSGVHSIRWAGKDDGGRIVSGGIYVAVLKTPAITLSRRMVYLK